MKTVTDFIFLGSKIIADGNCSHEIKGHLLLERKAMTNLSSVTQSYLTLCDPMNCSTPGLPVHHQLPESTQTHVPMTNLDSILKSRNITFANKVKAMVFPVVMYGGES